MIDVESVQDLARALTTAKRDLEGAQEDLERLCYESAAAEKAYRLARALSFTAARVEVGGRDSVSAREYVVDEQCADQRYQATLTENLRQSALERVRSCRGVLSAVQTLSNAWREEVALARTGPDDRP